MSNIGKIKPILLEPKIKTVKKHNISLTLVCNVKSRFILGIVAVEEEACFMGCAEERVRNLRPTEPVNHYTGLTRSASDLQVVVDCLGGEVQELNVNSLNNMSTTISDTDKR